MNKTLFVLLLFVVTAILAVLPACETIKTHTSVTDPNTGAVTTVDSNKLNVDAEQLNAITTTAGNVVNLWTAAHSTATSETSGESNIWSTVLSGLGGTDVVDSAVTYLAGLLKSSPAKAPLSRDAVNAKANEIIRACVKEYQAEHDGKIRLPEAITVAAYVVTQTEPTEAAVIEFGDTGVLKFP